MGILWPNTGATHYYSQDLEKYRAIKGLVVRNGWDLEPLNERSGPRLLLSVP